MNCSKFIGSTLIVIGTTIGAGMLAMPLISAPVGSFFATGALIAIWGLMSITGLLILEVNLALDANACSFSSMAEKTLGRAGKVVAWLSCLLLLYALTSAYVSGASSLLKEIFRFYFGIKIHNVITAILFVLVLGGAVFWSTKATDFLNRGLIGIKGVLLLVTLVLLMPYLDFSSMLTRGIIGNNQYLFGIFPIFITAFGYHTVIPSIRIYLGDQPKQLRNIILLGTTVSMVIYLIWLWDILNIVPLTGANSFEQIFKQKSLVDGLIAAITAVVNNKWVIYGLTGFSNIAMTTSFLGVTLGLFDFIADGFKRPDTRFGRLQTAGLTFVPPLIFAVYFHQGFILALSYAGIFVTILEIILPALMAYKLRYAKTTMQQTYRVFGGKRLLFVIATIGVSLVILQILISLHLLPEVI